MATLALLQELYTHYPDAFAALFPTRPALHAILPELKYHALLHLHHGLEAAFDAYDHGRTDLSTLERAILEAVPREVAREALVGVFAPLCATLAQACSDARIVPLVLQSPHGTAPQAAAFLIRAIEAFLD